MKKIISISLVLLAYSFSHSVSAMTDAQYRAEITYTETEHSLYEKLKAKPYGCIQKIDFEWPWAYYATANRLTTYENVCKNWMTDEEHEKAVQEFVPYLNSPSIFYDNVALWRTFHSNIISIKTNNQWSIEEEVNNLIIGLKKYKNKFIKTDVSDKVLKEFLLKKAKEIDPVLEKKKQQAIKQKAAQEKRKQEKLIKDTITPFSQYLNPKYNKYFYNSMQEHYIKILIAINDPKENQWETELDKNAAIINTANSFADYILEDSDFWSYDSTLVVKKWQEDALREKIMEDVFKRYPDTRALYEQVLQK